MRVTRFFVQGYKNLTAPILWEGVGPIVILHGDNNVGKSNLVEALALAFRLVEPTQDSTALPWSDRLTLSTAELRERTGVEASEIFNLDRPGPIQLELTLSVDEADLRGAGSGVEEALALEVLRVSLNLSLAPGGVALLRTLHLGKARRSPKPGDGGNEGQGPGFLALFVALRESIGVWGARPRFNLLNVHRQLLGQRAAGERQIIPDALALQLYDARESLDAELHARWQLFVQTVATFQDIVGPGEIVAVYDRANGRALLAMQQGSLRRPVHLLGSGAQQLIGLIGQILMSGASMLAIEEPELNLRYTHQLRLQRCLEALVADGRGPTQLFLTSHSAAFEGAAAHFFAMSPGPTGPTLQPMAAALAPRFTEQGGGEPSTIGAAPLSYVTTEGVVCMPQPVLDQMGLPRGGGVVFVAEGPGRAQVWSNEAFLQQMGEE